MGTARAFVIACALVGRCAAISAQPREFPRERREVAVVATVTDRDHHLVSGLTADDFEIRDNGQPRPIIGFDASRQPLSVTVMVDRSDSLSRGPVGVRASAARFIADLQPDDEARVCAFAGDITCSPRFTTDHDELAQQVRQFPTGFGTRLFDAVWSALDAMEMVPAGRRRVIVVFSDGEDNRGRTAFRHLMTRARSLDVMVYGIGLQTRIDDGDDIVSSRPDLTLMPLATETGGGYYEPGNPGELERTVTRIEKELRHQYVLAFYPVPDPDRSHRLDVRTTRQDLRVRSRRHFSTVGG
jgi:VWFA-related protein